MNLSKRVLSAQERMGPASLESLRASELLNTTLTEPSPPKRGLERRGRHLPPIPRDITSQALKLVAHLASSTIDKDTQDGAPSLVEAAPKMNHNP